MYVAGFLAQRAQPVLKAEGGAANILGKKQLQVVLKAPRTAALRAGKQR